ncbi:gamma carbonic anhydrase family protein [Bdellovibrio bacteriovorus]|uniref:Gamma carbonic anhydrase family protein n=1 Tax=Bdellovibrio bacteriovorus TaxID=959 RepID=A0A150WDX4_BDEBC|nr:gamma carbonic anhydrase family protein [Bdellovibrio bacteriovorus]KYG61173.1 gamma carbonic anhydrase family protein [Bdellovibrio bacteriovorus]KYG65204.1 gamma carbonic anhydrase family protein [Bdellovibrio bacteriovorus]
MSDVFVRARGVSPVISEDVFIADNARIISDVEIGEGSSIWYNVVIRGDVMPIRIGKEVNVQDGTVIHGTYGKWGTTLHDRVTIGHLVMLHGCEVGRGTLVGMGSILMDGVKVGEHCLIGAGSLLTEGTEIPPRSLVVGRPAKVKRPLTDEEVALLEKSADNYLLYKSWYE